MPDSEIPIGKTILELDALVGEVVKPTTYLEVHVDGQAESKKIALDRIIAGEEPGTPASNHMKTASIILKDGPPIEFLRLPFPPESMWTIELSAVGQINRSPAMVFSNTNAYANEAGVLVKSGNDVYFTPVDGTTTVPEIDGCQVLAEIDNGELVFSAVSALPISNSPVSFLILGIRDDGSGFEVGSSGGSGGLPAETTKMLQTLQLAAPAWFDMPYLEDAILEVTVEGKRVSLWLQSETPWATSTVDWGDGSQQEMPMDGSRPLNIGSLGKLGFMNFPLVRDYTDYGTFTITITVGNAYGSSTITREVNLTGAV